MQYEDYHERIAHRSTGRYDTSALATDLDVFEAITRDLVASAAVAADRVAGIDALGFVFGAAVARELDVGFAPIRKGGKLPLPTEDVLTETAIDYTGSVKTLEVDREAIRDDDRVLLVDDWIETAGQMTAAADLSSGRAARSPASSSSTPRGATLRGGSTSGTVSSPRSASLVNDGNLFPATARTR